MKIESVNPNKNYSPFSLTITVESAREAAALHWIFNFHSIVDTLHMVGPAREIREIIEAHDSEAAGQYGFITNSFNHFHNQ